MTRRHLLGALLGLPVTATAAPASGFRVSGVLTFSETNDNEVTVGLVTLTLHDPLLLDQARELIESEVCLSLARANEVCG